MKGQGSRGGHSHRRRSHSCDRGQEAVKGSRAIFGVGQAVKHTFQTQPVTAVKMFTICACVLHIV